MNNKALKILEYNKILLALSEHASTELGKKACLNLVPMSDMEDIQTAQAETDDAIKRLWNNNRISFSGVKDLGVSIKRLEVSSALSATELLDLSGLLDVTLRIKSFSRDYHQDYEKKDSLDARFDLLEPLSPLSNEIKRCILSPEEIADDASSELASIRRHIRVSGEKIHNQMNSLVTSQTTRTYLQDFVVTMRDGRYCLPVKAEYKNNINGLVHDQSSSGSTLFIEPMAVVELNNELRELYIQEKAEIERILAMLSEDAAGHVTDIRTDYEILTELDFIFAKAALSRDYKGIRPDYNSRRYISIKKGRHPLIDAKKVVPIDVWIGDAFDQLIITGPNTGGKTVTLKTIGLFTLMGQAGLQIPANEGSTLAVFSNVYADIGDEQSIEQNLSTFSSHMKNIISITNKADNDSLVLFDELCAGTDPIEGAALATSILSFLHNMKIRTVATTHYSELKLYALNEDGIENACCEFSVETLSPTYHLLIGIPGKSNAFAISKKLGLPDFLIDDAKKRIDSDKEAFEDIVSELETNRNALEKERIELSCLRSEAARIRDDLKKKNEQLDDRRDSIVRSAKEEARGILEEAKSFADETIRNINKYGSSSASLENERHKLRKKLDETYDSAAKAPKKTSSKQLKSNDIMIGDDVLVLSLNLKGTISSMPNDKGDLYVQMGILRSLVNISDIELIDASNDSKENKKSNNSNIMYNKSLSVGTEINLIGCNVDEAVSRLDKYLDDAYLAHMPKVRVVHGRGTGALRKGVWSRLKQLKYIDSYRLGEFGEGGDGVTVVTFK